MVIRATGESHLKDPGMVTVLFSDTRMATAWLLARLYVGWLWFDDGRQKVTSVGWMEGGEPLRAYWAHVLATQGEGGAASSGGWYREVVRFMLENQWYGWMGKAIAVGEVLIGLALLLGLLTGLAAFLGSMLSFSFLLAGPASVNPLVFVLALGLIAAWKVAGYIGLDAFFLPRLGAPWRAGLSWERIRPGGRPGTA